MPVIEVSGLTKTFRTYKKQPGFAGALKGKAEVQAMKLKVGGPDAKVYFPQQVYVTPAGANPGE